MIDLTHLAVIAVLAAAAGLYAHRFHRLRMLSTTLEHDVQAQRATTDALRRDEAKLRSITNAIPGALVQYRLGPDGHGRILFLNDGAAALFGCSIDDLQRDVMLAWSRVPRQDLDRMLAARAESAATLTNWVQEFRVVDGGAVRWVRGEAVPSRERDGGTLWHSILTDVTETKRLEEALREREEGTCQLYELAHATDLDFPGRVRAVLRMLRRRFDSDIAVVSRVTDAGMELLFVDGESPRFGEGEVLGPGQSFSQAVMHADGPIGCPHVGASGWRNHPAYARTRIESFIGVPFAVDHTLFGAICVLARHPRATGFDGSDRDLLRQVSIWLGAEWDREQGHHVLRAAHEQLERGVADRTTELTSANARLRLSEERLRHALAVGRMGIWERDLRAGTTIWDERLREILGVPQDGAVDRQAWLFDRLGEDHRRQLRELVQAAEAGGPGYVFECRYQRPDGQWIWISTSGGPRLDERGVPTHVAGLIADITARKESENEFRRLATELDGRVVERTRDLADSRRRLRALLGELTRAEERERRRLAAELHDTLTQTLTLGRMNVSRASRLLDEGADRARVVEVLNQTQSTLDSSIAYTRTLISELSPRVLYDFGLAVALQWLGDQMRPHGLQVVIAGDPDELDLRDDLTVLVFQSVRELLWNVVKHAESAHAEVSWHVELGELRLAVEDAGRGFSEATSAHGGGFGLLNIRERVALQGGRFDVRSERGRGTRVLLRLPLESAREDLDAKNERRPWVETGGSKPIRVVLVDDHSMVREGLCRVLDEHRNLAIVGQAGDGLDAVELVERCDPDVVIMDVNLPRISGIEATRRILDRAPHALVIGISSGADEFVAKAMKGAGAVACVMKERAVEDLYQAIDDAVAGRLQGPGAPAGPGLAGGSRALH